ncbi:MAG: hypothetical protein AB7S36_00660, partial [Planctomycetota bacterium]
NLALILAEFLDELPPEAMPGPRLMDAIADAMPRPMLIGHRGRVQGIWWYGVPSFGALFDKIKGNMHKDMLENYEDWLYRSRFPDGHHSGPLGPIKATALAAVAAASRIPQ